MTIVTITLMAFAALIAGRTFGVQLRASTQERLIIEDRLTARNAERIMDAWMADPVFSTAITDNGEGAGQWRTPEGSLGCSPPTDSTCWQFTTTDPTTTNPQLRGGEAEQDIRDIIIEIRSGCFNRIEHCQRTTEITRVYERSVFAQYQLHYERDTAPDKAFNGPDGIPNPTECELDPVPDGTACDDPRPELRGLRVVFTSDDTLNGPLRYSGGGEIRYCGTPTFKLIESKSASRPAPAGLACPSRPSWLMDDGTTRQWPISHTDPLDADRFVTKGDELDLPTISPPQQGCPLATVNYDHNFHITDKDRRENNPGDCPGEPGQNAVPHAILDGDIITSTGSITIERLNVEGSVTVYAEGDIIICGDIEASGTNPAGGPNVIALITEGAVVLDPSGTTPPTCHNGTLTELTTAQNVTLTNVAVLAPGTNGAVYARGWHLPHALTGGPTLIIEGSIAATHLGLYGIPNPSGGVTNGWSKQFTYPTDDPNTDTTNEAFWRARPPWWPDLSLTEWQPIE